MASGEFAIASEEWSLRGGEAGKFKHFLAILPSGVRKFLPFVTFSPAPGDKLDLPFFSSLEAVATAPLPLAGMVFHG